MPVGNFCGTTLRWCVLLCVCVSEGGGSVVAIRACVYSLVPPRTTHPYHLSRHRHTTRRTTRGVPLTCTTPGVPCAVASPGSWASEDLVPLIRTTRVPPAPLVCRVPVVTSPGSGISEDFSIYPQFPRQLLEDSAKTLADYGMKGGREVLTVQDNSV